MELTLLRGDRSEPTLDTDGEKGVVKLPYRDNIVCVTGCRPGSRIELRHDKQCLATHTGANVKLEVFFLPHSKGEIHLLIDGKVFRTISYVRFASE